MSLTIAIQANARSILHSNLITSNSINFVHFGEKCYRLCSHLLYFIFINNWIE